MRLLALLLPLCTIVLWAQVTASISGRMKDATGAGPGLPRLTICLMLAEEVRSQFG